MIIGRLRIRSSANFATLTSRHPITSVYYYSILDCLFDLVHRVSQDFIRRPHLYFTLTDPNIGSVTPLIGDLYAQYGTEATALGNSQRKALYTSLFGSCTINSNNETGDFPRLTRQIVDASSAFAERVLYGGEQMLQEAVVSAHRPFRQYLDKLSGDSVSWARDRAFGPLAQACYVILRNRGVAAVFGVDTPPVAQWPYVEDANGDTLVSEISKQLATLAEKYEMGTDEEAITRERFSNLQRSALRGAEALAAILRFDENAGVDDTERDQNVNALITACYTWGSALKALEVVPTADQASLMTEDASAVAPSKLARRLASIS